MKISGIPQVMEMDPLSQEQYGPTHILGEAVVLADQRIFRYGADGGSGLAAGKLAVGPTPDTALQTMAVVSGAKGSNQLVFTAGATTASNSAYDDGYAIISYGTGLGQTYKIQHCPAITSGGTITMTLQDALVVGLDTTSKLDIVQNRYGAAQNSTATTILPLGVPHIAVTASYYCWLQTKGICGLLAAGTLLAGEAGIAVATSGAVTVPGGTWATDAAAQAGAIASGYYQGASGYYHAVFLHID